LRGGSLNCYNQENCEKTLNLSGTQGVRNMSKRGWLKIWALLFCVSLLYCSKMESAEIKVESRISEVTVYPASALINRTASLKLKRGEYEIVFADIVPEVDENSLRVSASGEAKVKLFGAQLKKEYLEEVPTEKIKRLQEEIQNLEDEVKAMENLRKLLLEEKNFLDSIRLFSHQKIPQDLVTKMPTPEDLEKILKFLDAKLKENYSRLMEAELSIREKKKKIDVLKRELNQIRGPVKKLKRSIVVQLQVLKAGNLDLSVSYMVRGAFWRPIYDARASFEKNEVELVFYGIVRQTTGEDWKDVEIILSTAKPAIGGRMPYVSPWFLRPYQPIVRRKGLKIEAPMYQRMAFEEEMRPGEGRRPEVEYARVEEKGIAVVYKLARKATVKSDGV